MAATSADQVPTTMRSIRPAAAAQASALVAAWTAIGYLLPPDPTGLLPHDANLYLLIGIPLTLGFQVLVRRRPIRELWVRGAPAFTLDRAGRIIAALLLLAPTVGLVQVLLARQWVLAGWMAAAVAGALPAAWTLRRLRRDDLRTWGRWVLLISAIGVVIMSAMLVPQAAAAGWPGSSGLILAAVLEAVVLYVPVQFLLEEVTFRGLIDTHVHDERARRQWPSALLVSALWGLWHLPVVAATGQPLWLTVGQMLLVHGLIGVPMSLAWRRTGTLLVPVIAHAVINAVRNALMVGL